MIKKQEGDHLVMLVEDVALSYREMISFRLDCSFLVRRWIAALINRGFQKQNIGSSKTSHIFYGTPDELKNITYSMVCKPKVISVVKMLITVVGFIISEQVENGYKNISWRMHPELTYNRTTSSFRWYGGKTREQWLDRMTIYPNVALAGFNPLEIEGVAPQQDVMKEGYWCLYMRLRMHK